MAHHDIIDNRHQLLVDEINRMLETSERGRFAVGYLFISGLSSIGDAVVHLKELRLLIGNTSNRHTIEQLAEAHRRLDVVAEAAEAEKFPKRAEAAKIASSTADNIGSALELMDQSSEAERLLGNLADMIDGGRLKVRVFTGGRLHAKAYIFDYGPIFDPEGKPLERHEQGIAVVGSSNLSLAGIEHNTELNVVVQGNANHQELGRWFEELWLEGQDFTAALMEQLQQSWALMTATPYDIYMKSLYRLVRERMGESDGSEVLWDDEITSRLADFQKVAVRQAIQILRDVGGAIVADVVGLGKSYVGAAVVKHFELTDRARPLIICPATLVDMWERYNEVYTLNARVLSMGYLREDDDGLANLLLTDARFRDRDFVLIDESHNFRHADTQRYRLLQGFLATGRRCCLLTATPRNKSIWDVYNQIKLFQPDDKTDLPIEPPNLRDYFRLIDRGERKLPEVLRHVQVRRLRNHVLRWYGFDSETDKPVDPANFRPYLEGTRRAYVIVGGNHQFFPRRELDTIEYNIEAAYQGLYQQIRAFLGRPGGGVSSSPTQRSLTYARYGLWHFVKQKKRRSEPYATLEQAGPNIRGLMRVLLFKRLESSVFAFRETLRRLIVAHDRFLAALRQGIIAAGEEAQAILHEADEVEEDALLEALRQVTGRYSAEDFEVDKLQRAIEHDLQVLREVMALIEPITPEKDAKLQTLLSRLEASPLKDGKTLIFTQYADTARYLYANLNPDGQRTDIDVIFSGDKSKARIVGRFAPNANPEYRFSPNETELMTVVATDVLAEGLNLQDCNKVVNYDLHWNPVRLIQRFGRIDRIGSAHDVIFAFNFLPELGIEKNLHLRQRLEARIQEIHDTIGEDAAVLDKTERLNQEAMYAIYEKRGGQLALFEDDEDESVDLAEAEEIFRVLRRENPEEFRRIAALKDGIRSAKRVGQAASTFVFCEAGRFQQLFLVNTEGEIVSRDLPKVLAAIKSSTDILSEPIPAKHSEIVAQVKRTFTEEVRRRKAELEHTLGLTQAQRFVLRELRLLHGGNEDEEVKAQIAVLEPAFRGPLTNAIQRELNVLRRGALGGPALLQALARIYHQHNMSSWTQEDQKRGLDAPPVVVCSEALV